MSACEIVFHEILAYEKRVGKKPSLLILVDKEMKNDFFTSHYFVTMKHDILDFKTPGYFFGVPVYFKDIWIYGGSCSWMLVGDQ